MRIWLTIRWRGCFPEGLYVTLNSDDPPMFNTTLPNEYRIAAQTFSLSAGDLEKLDLNALRAAFLRPSRKPPSKAIPGAVYQLTPRYLDYNA